MCQINAFNNSSWANFFTTVRIKKLKEPHYQHLVLSKDTLSTLRNPCTLLTFIYCTAPCDSKSDTIIDLFLYTQLVWYNDYRVW